MTKYVVGFNMPGYLPDSDPQEYDNYEDALNGLIQGLEDALENIPDDAEESSKDEAEELGEMILALKGVKYPAEQGFTIGKWHYFLSEV